MSALALDRRFRPALSFAGLVVLISVVAYTGHVPRAIAAHGIDKILHAGMGAALTWSLAVALRGRAFLAGALVLVPLALDEYLQRFSTSRSSEWADLLADILGIGFAIVTSSARRALRSEPPPSLG